LAFTAETAAAFSIWELDPSPQPTHTERLRYSVAAVVLGFTRDGL
jgi:hypothetical protein